MEKGQGGGEDEVVKRGADSLRSCRAGRVVSEGFVCNDYGIIARRV